MKLRQLTALAAALSCVLVLLAGCSSGSDSSGAGSQPAGGSSSSVSQTGSSSSVPSSSPEAGSITEPGASSSVPESSGSEEPVTLSFSLMDIDGADPVASEDVFSDAKLTMLNVWATYCDPCLKEMPYLGELSAEYDPSQFQIVGLISDVNDDADEVTLDYARELIGETGADYRHLLFNDSLYSTVISEVTAVPTTFFLDQNGAVVYATVGSRDKTAWKEIIDGLLAQV